MSDFRQNRGRWRVTVEVMVLDDDSCIHAIETADPRFDGWIFVGVTSTGIYCRPSCPARTPKRENMRFFATAAGAQAAGFRACKRCRPDATPGSPEWDLRADAVGRAMRLIADGTVDREGVRGLAVRLGYSERHLNRMLIEAVGVGPLALARAQRAQTARVLLETTELPVIDVAFAAGFRSVRQFNAVTREVFSMTPGELRRRFLRGGRNAGRPGAISLRLPYRAPIDADALMSYLAARAVPGVEAMTPAGYCRSMRLPHGEAVVQLAPADGHFVASFWLSDLRDLNAAITRCRSLLDLDSDPAAVAERLARDPLLAPLVGRSPGRRVPGCVDGGELALRTVIGQQVSVKGAVTLAARLTANYGDSLKRPIGAVTTLFPAPEQLAVADPDTLPMPRARRRALLGLATEIADGAIELSPWADRDETQRKLAAVPGIGPWTVSYVAMRALRDPDALVDTDLGVRRALERLGHDGSPRSVERLANAWRPYRAYAVQHLWASLDPAITSDGDSLADAA